MLNYHDATSGAVIVIIKNRSGLFNAAFKRNWEDEIVEGLFHTLEDALIFIDGLIRASYRENSHIDEGASKVI